MTSLRDDPCHVVALLGLERDSSKLRCMQQGFCPEALCSDLPWYYQAGRQR